MCKKNPFLSVLILEKISGCFQNPFPLPDVEIELSPWHTEARSRPQTPASLALGVAPGSEGSGALKIQPRSARQERAFLALCPSHDWGRAGAPP